MTAFIFHNAKRHTIIAVALWMGQLRLKENQQLAQGHTIISVL